jgi:hypothetical protein
MDAELGALEWLRVAWGDRRVTFNVFPTALPGKASGGKTKTAPVFTDAVVRNSDLK